jgi:hypothetical protein
MTSGPLSGATGEAEKFRLLTYCTICGANGLLRLMTTTPPIRSRPMKP